MNTHIKQLVCDLPEIYQPVYGYPEWNSDASRECNQRLAQLQKQYLQLSRALGRPLRVLDLGCAQGFFSLSLAAMGACVHGVDFQQQNIDLCQALAENHPQLEVSFATGRIEEMIGTLEKDQFDLVTGLSVFHHLVHLHGVEQVRQWITRLADCTQVVILELALKQEPLYWAESQPEDPRELIESCAFYRMTGEFDTHLSDICRPMYLISNHRVILDDFCDTFSRWSDRPYRGAGSAHKLSRRYFYGETFICKLFNHSVVGEALTDSERARNSKEIDDEARFLSHPPADFPAPGLLAHGRDNHVSWLVMEKLPGRLLSDLLAENQTIDAEKIISAVLDQLVALEKEGLFHDDVRTWNVLVDSHQQARLIDFGSISSTPQDCSWPQNLFQSFFIFVNEVTEQQPQYQGFWRSAPAHPFSLRRPWSNWLYAFWQQPVAQWSFGLLRRLFAEKSTLPDPQQSLTATDLWIATQDILSLEIQTRVRQPADSPAVNQLEQRLKQLETAFGEVRQHYQQEMQALKSACSANFSELEQYYQQLSERVIAAGQPLTTEATPESVTLPPDTEELRQQLEHTRRELQRFQQENQYLHQEIEKIHRSRSWKMTRPYRYAGLQVLLLKQYGLKQRGRHLVKRILTFAIAFLRRHPALRRQMVTLLYKTGLYPRALRLYQRMNPLNQADMQSEAQTLSGTEKQIANPDLLPSEVKDLFHRLTKRK